MTAYFRGHCLDPARGPQICEITPIRIHTVPVLHNTRTETSYSFLSSPRYITNTLCPPCLMPC